MKRPAARLALALTSLALALGIVDLCLGASGAPDEAVRAALYYQGVDLDLHEAVDDPRLHYRLKPSAHAEGAGPYGNFSVHIGPDGDRGPTAEAAREVWVFGASTVFGVGVSDDETLPAHLARALTEGTGQATRARNFGVSAYVLPQMARAAATTLQRLPPPALIIIVHTNPGRRPFLLNAARDPLAAFSAEPDHWPENFPPPAGLPEAAHVAALRWSAAYRLLCARHLQAEPPEAPTSAALSRIAQREVAALDALAEAAGVPVVWALYPDGERPARRPEVLRARDVVDLFSPGQPAEHYNLHPSSAALKRHADTLGAHVRSR